MIVGVPREIKPNEYRVALVPSGVEALVRAHRVLVQTEAGAGSGFPDEMYEGAGGEIADGADAVWGDGRDDRQGEGAGRRRARPSCVRARWSSPTSTSRPTRSSPTPCSTASAWPSPTRPSSCRRGELPLLTPMSEVAGRLAVQEGAKHLEKENGGFGILLGGVPGVPAGGGRDPRRRRRRHERREDRRRPRRARHDPRHRPRPPALPVRRDAGQRRPRCTRTAITSSSRLETRRPADRGRAPARRPGARACCAARTWR